MMQTGAFLQHILTFVAITSRLSMLFTELCDVMQLCWQLCLDLLQILDVSVLFQAAGVLIS